MGWHAFAPSGVNLDRPVLTGFLSGDGP